MDMTFVLLIEHKPKIQNYKCINYKFVILDNKHNGQRNWKRVCRVQIECCGY